MISEFDLRNHSKQSAKNNLKQLRVITVSFITGSMAYTDLGMWQSGGYIKL